MTIVKFETKTTTDKSIFVKDCVPGNIYKVVAGYKGSALSDPNYCGKITIAYRGMSQDIHLQEIGRTGGKDYITNQYWKVEEIENVIISY